MEQQSPPRLPADKNLLLLGLQLLNKGLRGSQVPCAVVHPQIKTRSPPEENGVNQKEGTNSGKRKRDPDDDISEGERRQKRKLMNRVAAQNARDRKKLYMDELERKVAILETQNRQLQQENVSLKDRTATLTLEKQQLEQKLSESSQADFLHALVKESLLESHWSAVPCVSQQQKQVPKALLLQAWMTISLMSWLVSLKNTSAPSHVIESHGDHVTQLLPRDQLLRILHWWGASQATWNPPRTYQ